MIGLNSAEIQTAYLSNTPFQNSILTFVYIDGKNLERPQSW